MMKKTLSLILARFVLCSAAWAAADDGVLFETEYYTLTLPDNWKIDLDDLEEDDKFEELGFMYAREDDGLAIEAALEYFESLDGISLWDAGEEDFQAYVDMILEEFAEDGAVVLDPVNANGIPFIIIRCEDDDGEYLYAETVTNGYVLSFYAYALDWDSNYLPLEEKHLDTFREILSTFQPNTQQA